MKYTANITETALKSGAMARARVLVQMTAELGGVDLTERDFEIAMLGAEIAISACVATLRAASDEETTTA